MRIKFTYVILGALLCLPIGIVAQDFSNIREAKPITLNGSIDARTLFYNATGISNRREPFSYVLSGSPTVSLYGWKIPFSFSYSKEQKSFRQPFNQFGMSPTYKWITLHAGYRNLNFSQYTLGGHTMLGAGFELKPGKWRTGFMYGRLNRATVIDTLSHALVPFSFSRKGYAAKLGYGTDRNYFDLSFLKAKDDSTTRPVMDKPISDAINVLPESNAVLGFKSRFTIYKNYFIESDGAVSVYTEDMNSPFHLDSLENKFLEKLKNTFDINGTSSYFTALSVGAGFAEKYFGLKINYRRIDPNFKTMGAYYFNNDLEAWTINPSFRLASGLLRGNVSIGTQKNNIKNQKESTNNRFIGAANISAQFTPNLGMDVVYNNFSNNQTPKALAVGNSVKIVQTNQTFSVMPRYVFSKNELHHMFMVSANISGLKDHNSFMEVGNPVHDQSSSINTQQFMANYSITIPKKNLSLFSSFNYTVLDREVVKDTYQGVTLGGNFSFDKNKARVGLNTSFMQGDSELLGKSMIINASLNGSYQVRKGQSVRLMVFLTNNNPGSVVSEYNPSFTETRSELAYVLSF